MTSRPVVDRPPVLLPAYPGSSSVWPALIELSNSTRPEWTLVGGQMVALQHNPAD